MCNIEILQICIFEIDFHETCLKKLTFQEKCWLLRHVFCSKIEFGAVQKCANLVELEKYCKTHIYLQNLVSIQPRTSPPKNCEILEDVANFANVAS